MFPRRTWGFSSSDTVYLTFDDGPTPELTEWILEELARDHISATFFCVGENARKYPDLMDRIRQQGHAIGNHTMQHEKGTKTSYGEYRDSIDQAAPLTDAQLFRPPYGRLPMGHGRKVGRKYRIVMWSWLSYDYDPKVPVEEILQAAEQIRPGDIIVLHDNRKVEERIKALLPELVEILKRKGYRFGLISA